MAAPKLKRVKPITLGQSTKMGPSGEFLRKQGTKVDTGRQKAQTARKIFRAEFTSKPGATVDVGRQRAQATRKIFRAEFTSKPGLKTEIGRRKAHSVRKVARAEFMSKPGTKIETGRQKAQTARKIFRAIAEPSVTKIKSITKKPPGFGADFAKKLVTAHEANLKTLGEKAVSSSKTKVGSAFALATGRKKLIRRGLGTVGGAVAKKVLGSALGRVAAPAALAHDVYTIGKAGIEGVKAMKAYTHTQKHKKILTRQFKGVNIPKNKRSK